MKHTRLKPETLVRLLNKLPEWRAEHRSGHVFAYWQNECKQHHTGWPTLSIPDNSFLAKVSMRHSNHGNFHLDWYDAIYKMADVPRITKEIHRVFSFSRVPIDTKVSA